MVEDFSTYTEVDPGSTISKTSTRVTYASLNTRNTDSYVYADKGVAHFAGNFTHLVTVNVSASDNAAQSYSWMLANTVNDALAILATADGYLAVYDYKDTGSGQNRLNLGERYSGGNVSDYYNVNGTGSLPYTYYLEIERDEAVGTYGTAYARIYSDSGRTMLVDTLAITLGHSVDFRYVYALNTYNSGSSVTRSGYVENLDLQEAAGVARHLVDGGLASAPLIGGLVR